MQRRRLVRVPASSANLGPGFDTFACAVAMHMQLEVEETGRFAVHTDLKNARDRRNLAVRGFAQLADPGRFAFRIESQIPLSGGLGSSAAAYVAGLLAADHLFELDADVLALATELEGHPDNVDAALRGGFVICADGQATRFDPPAGLEAVVLVPHEAVRTRQDPLPQPRRASLFPRSYELLQRATELGALGATISGAGPAVLFWSHYEQTGSLYDELHAEAPDCKVRRVQFDPSGADVRALA